MLFLCKKKLPVGERYIGRLSMDENACRGGSYREISRLWLIKNSAKSIETTEKLKR